MDRGLPLATLDLVGVQLAVPLIPYIFCKKAVVRWFKKSTAGEQENRGHLLAEPVLKILPLCFPHLIEQRANLGR
jgi:hypothetical protein